MKTAAILAVCFALFCVLYADLFARYLPDDAQWYKIALASFLMLIPAAIFLNTPHYISEMRLLRRAAQPRLERDRRVAVAGRLLPYGELLKAPFSGTPCVSYSYGVYRWTGTKNRTREYDCAGSAMTPCFVRTALGDIRVSGYLEGTPSDFDADDPEVQSRARAYVSSTRFEQLEPAGFLQRLTMVKELATDESGAIRQDWKRAAGSIDLRGRHLEESVLLPDRPSCVIGTWDGTKGGLVSRPLGSGALTVLEGDPAMAVKTMRGRMISATIIALVLIVFVNGFLYGWLS